MSVCVCVSVSVCVSTPRAIIASGMMWRDMTTYDWLNKFYSCYMATIDDITNGCGLALILVRKTNAIRVSQCRVRC